jgi:putative FmdB family regulatory protein
MPTYDYTCLDCRKRFDIFLTYKEYGVKPVACSHCSSANVRRRVPRVRVLKSDESRFDSIADPAQLAGIENDPAAMGQMFRKLGSEMGEDLPPQFDEVVDRLEAGQRPEEISSAVPDWGGDDDVGGGGGHEHHDHSHDDD